MTLHWKHALTLVVALSLSQAAAAQGRGNANSGKDKSKGPRVEVASTHDVLALDRDGQLRIVRDYFHGRSLPPGLAKRDSLPPGLAKQLRERGELPPGLHKPLVAVPAGLHARLPPLPPSHRRYFVGRDLVVVDSLSNRVISILRDLLD